MESERTITRLVVRLGKEEVVGIQCARKVIDSNIRKILDSIATSDIIYDDIFHLQLIVITKRGPFTIEKNSTVNVTYHTMKDRPDQLLNIELKKPVTVHDLLNNAFKKYGKQKFYKYDAFNNNCQDFVMMILDSNDLLFDYAKKWIKQDAEQILHSLPRGSDLLANLLTSMHAWLVGGSLEIKPILPTLR